MLGAGVRMHSCSASSGQVAAMFPPRLPHKQPARRYTSGGVVQAAFYIQLFNAVLPALFSLFDVFRMVVYHVFSSFARSQSFLNWCLSPPVFDLPERFANAGRTISLAILYAPILPVSPIIGAAGILTSYLTDQWLALQVCQNPRAFESNALELASSMLGLLPIAQLLLIYLLYFKGNSGDTLAPFIVGVVILAAVVLLPIKQQLKMDRRRDVEDGGTDDKRCAPLSFLGWLTFEDRAISGMLLTCTA
jgi:hypothetical protein